MYILTIYDGTTALADFIARRAAVGTGYFDQFRFLGTSLTTVTDTDHFSGGEWHYVEIYWYAGTGANGGWTLWIDGDQVGTQLNANLSAYAADSITCGIRAFVTEATDYIYIDDIKGNTTGPIGAYAEEGGGLSIPVAMHHYKMQRRVF